MAKNRAETIIFGIHIGNTSMCLAYSKKDEVRVVANEKGERIMPACVSSNGKRTLVGSAAKERMYRKYSITVLHNKRLMNDNIPNEVLASIENKSSYKVIRDLDDIKYELKHDDKITCLTVKSVTKLIFAKLYELANGILDAELGASKLKAVICCPLNWPQSSRILLAELAEEQGFHVLQVISEPSAIALAYEIGSCDPDEDIWALIYRVGGLSMDVSLLEVHQERYSIHKSVSKPELGGHKFTSVLTEFLAKEFNEKYEVDPRGSKFAMAKLFLAAENCKHALSLLESAQCFVESLCCGVDFSYHVTRSKFESLISPLIHEYIEPIKEVLRSVNIEARSISRILLSGGSVKVAEIENELRAMFPHAEIMNSLNRDEVIAIGAAKQGNNIPKASELKSRQISKEISVVSGPIYIKGSGIRDVECIVPGRTPVPVSKSTSFLVKPSEKVVVDVFQDNANQNGVAGLLGTLSLGASEYPMQLALTVKVNRSGGLSAELRDTTGVKMDSFKLHAPKK